MSLSFVDPAERPAQLNALLYGGVGIGKSTGACSAPGPVLVVEAEPGNPLDFARRKFGNDHIRQVDMTGGEVLDEVGLYLREGGDGARTVVLDSLGEIYRVLVEELAADGHPNLRGKPSLDNYGDAGTKLERFCRFLVDLPVNVVLVAHELVVKDEAAGHFERLPHTGTSNPALGVKLMAMVDVVAYCGRREAEKQGDGPRFIGQLFSGGGRRGKTRSPFHVLGDSRDLDLSEWVATAVSEAPKPVAANTAGKSNSKKKEAVK